MERAAIAGAVWREVGAHERSWALSMKPELTAGSWEKRGARRRRFWSSDAKRRMVAESVKLGASVSIVAQRYGANANVLFTWRRVRALGPIANSSLASRRERITPPARAQFGRSRGLFGRNPERATRLSSAKVCANAKAKK